MLIVALTTILLVTSITNTTRILEIGGQSENSESYRLRLNLISGTVKYPAFLEIESLDKSKGAEGDAITGYEFRLEIFNTTPGKERFSSTIRIEPAQKTQMIQLANGVQIDQNIPSTTVEYNFGYGLNSKEEQKTSVGIKFEKSTESNQIFTFYDMVATEGKPDFFLKLDHVSTGLPSEYASWVGKLPKEFKIDRTSIEDCPRNSFVLRMLFFVPMVVIMAAVCCFLLKNSNRQATNSTSSCYVLILTAIFHVIKIFTYYNNTDYLFSIFLIPVIGFLFFAKKTNGKIPLAYTAFVGLVYLILILTPNKGKLITVLSFTFLSFAVFVDYKFGREKIQITQIAATYNGILIYMSIGIFAQSRHADLFYLDSLISGLPTWAIQLIQWILHLAAMALLNHKKKEPENTPVNRYGNNNGL